MRFEEYVDEQGSALLRLACALTSDAHLAEDLTQTVLAEAYRHWSRVCRAQQPDAYVRRMLVNAHLDWHRRMSSTERPTDLRIRKSRSVPDHSDGLAVQDELRRALTTLPPRTRTALVLRYYADLDDAAIADAMEVAQSTVRSTIARALTTLRASGIIDTCEETS